MSPRPRSASDADILAGVMRTVGRIGATGLTLAAVAHEVGLAPATLIQRFGSKRALLLATLEHSAAQADSRFDRAKADHPSPLAALVAAATGASPLASPPIESAEALGNHLAFLQIGLGDPDFRRLALDRSQRTLDGYWALIEEAIAAGELVPTNAGRLARGVHAVVRGSLLNWAIHRDGMLLPWMRDDLEILLSPFRRRDSATGATEVPRPAAGPRARHKL